MRTDGIIATTVIVDYLKRITNNVTYTYRERDSGHGVNYEDIDNNTDLLIIVDSSSSQVEEVNKLSEQMDVIILDHHNIEETDTEMNAILVNPKQQDDNYPNKDLSGSGVVWKFVEVMDYQYKKVNVHNYLDLIAVSLLSDQMRVDVLENRWIIRQGFSKIHNVGLLALIYATRNNNKELNSQIMNFNIIPLLNTSTRNNEMYKAFKLLFEKDFFKAKRMAKIMVDDNKQRKENVKKLFNEYDQIAENEKFVYAVTDKAEKNYNGLVSQKLSSTYRKPAFVLKDNGGTYSGSARTYNDFNLQTFCKQSNLIEYAAGHEGAFGFSIKAENWNEFKEYVNNNIDDTLFEPIIKYDIELTEDDLTWEVIDKMLAFDKIWGNGSSKIKVKLTDVFVEDKELFPSKKKEHVKIKAEDIDMLKFNDPEYASDVDSFDIIDVVGDIGINTFKGVMQPQLFIEDYATN